KTTHMAAPDTLSFSNKPDDELIYHHPLTILYRSSRDPEILNSIRATEHFRCHDEAE
ncbi:hypothetical protein PV326_013186, partial [Microctonus aethiopoides]